MNARILLVEDDPVSRDLIAALLASRGHAVDTAEDGFNALRLAQETPYDLVFIDYHLPEMDGYALARLIRSLSEKAERALKMVAITADRFGLAARRGADTIFDHMLAKPIEPDALFAFVEKLVGEIETTQGGALDEFFDGPTTNDAQSAAHVLWRVRGIGSLPRAAIFPTPTAAERASLDYCFQVVPPQSAECLVLLRQDGLADVERVRADGAAYLQPLFTIDPALASVADINFQVGDGESWTAAATALTAFAARRAEIEPDTLISKDFDTRLLAYMHVADRGLVLRRDGFGRTSVPYTGGFAASAVIEAVRRLAAKGMVSARPGAASDDGQRELTVVITGKGRGVVARAQAVVLPAG